MSKYCSMMSERAGLALLAQQMSRQRIWQRVEDRVKIGQKKVSYAPSDKLKMMLVNLLSGGKRVSAINRVVRPQPAVYRLFGLSGCADQSTINRTLSACDQTSVAGMRGALRQVFQRYSQAYRHAYGRQVQLVDIDVTGLLGGRQGEGVCAGYFSEAQGVGRGRQLGRVLATRYDEIVYQQVAEGNEQLAQQLHGLVQGMEEQLDLDANRRRRTLIRMDSGGGQEADVRWLLQRGYLLLVKLYHQQRARRLTQRIPEREWQTDPRQPRREVAAISANFDDGPSTRLVAVRWRPQSGKNYRYAVLLTNAPSGVLAEVSGYLSHESQAALLQVVYSYDLRGGGLETHNRGDKQGLGIDQAYTQAWFGQIMLLLLAELAHNLLIWFGRRLPGAPGLSRLGMQRLVRDVLTIPGELYFDHLGRLHTLVLNVLHPHANAVYRAFSPEWSRLNLRLLLRKI